MTPIEALTERVNALEASIIQMQQNLTQTNTKADNAISIINAINPYTDTKRAYYGETEKTFYEVPLGYVTVYFDNYEGSYSVKRIEDRVIVYFDALLYETNVTISVQ